MTDLEAGRAGPANISSAARRRERGLRGIARAQLTRHRRLSKLSVKELRRALAQWLRGRQP